MKSMQDTSNGKEQSDVVAISIQLHKIKKGLTNEKDTHFITYISS